VIERTFADRRRDACAGSSTSDGGLARLPPIFICGIARSGTTLLAGLLDAHPALAVLPNETYCYRELFLKRRLTRLALNTAEFLELDRVSGVLASRPVAVLSFVGQGGCMKGLRDWSAAFANESGVPESVVAAAARARVSRRDPWPTFLRLYECSVNEALGQKKFWVEKTPMNERFVSVSERLFRGRARYLHVVRDPRAILASWLKGQRLNRIVRRREVEVVDVCFAWARSVHQAVKNAGRCEGRYSVVRYEDLVEDTAAVTTNLATFLGIEPCGSLLRPTRLGRPTISNSSYEDLRGREAGVVATQVDRFAEELSPSEIVTIEGGLGAQMQALGYETRETVEDGGAPSWGASGGMGLEVWAKIRKMAWLQDRFVGVTIPFATGTSSNRSLPRGFSPDARG
jgi:hypothetical protein